MRPHKYYTAEPEAVTTFPDGRQRCNKNASGKREYLARTVEMWERQNGNCAVCGHPIELRYAQFDHQAGRGHGGGHRTDAVLDAEGNWINAAVHGICNIRKGSKRYHWVGKSYLPVITARELQEKIATVENGVEFCLSEEFLPEL